MTIRLVDDEEVVVLSFDQARALIKELARMRGYVMASPRGMEVDRDWLEERITAMLEALGVDAEVRRLVYEVMEGI